MKQQGAPFHKVDIFYFFAVLYIFDPWKFENRHICPRWRFGAREHFSKIQKHFISAFFLVYLFFRPLRIRIWANFFEKSHTFKLSSILPKVKLNNGFDFQKIYFTLLRKKDANSQKVPWFNFSLWFMFQRQCVSCDVWLLEVYHLIILFFLNWFFLPYRRRSTETFLLTLFFVFYLKMDSLAPSVPHENESGLISPNPGCCGVSRRNPPYFIQRRLEIVRQPTRKRLSGTVVMK